MGHDKDGFLHYLDLCPSKFFQWPFVDKSETKKLNRAHKEFHKKKDTLKEGKIQDCQAWQKFDRHVSSEPISSMGPKTIDRTII